MAMLASTHHIYLSIAKYLKQFSLIILVPALVLAASIFFANTDFENVSGIRVNRAELTSLGGTRSVQLPHILRPADYSAKGSTVRYRLDVELAQVPQEPLAVLVPKMSLSGRLYLNGNLIGSCGHDTLANLRCLYQSPSFEVPAQLWRKGNNRLEFDVYATPRQMNGLSVVVVGGSDTLHEQIAWRKWVHKDLLIGLMWISAAFGVLALGIGLILRNKSVYIWFGLTSIANAAASLNDTVSTPSIPIDVFNWLAFWTRLVSVPLLYLTMLALFEKSRAWITRFCVTFILMAPIAIWFSDNNRTLAASLYLPWLLLAPPGAFLTLRWSLRSNDNLQKLVTGLMLVLTFGGVYDWLRTIGISRFENNHLLPYQYGGTLIILGLAFLRSLAKALDASELRSALLEKQAAERLVQHVSESAKRFRNFFNLPLVGTAITSTEKGWIDVNDQTCQVLGYDREALVTKSWAEITHPDDLAADEALFKKMLNGEINGYSLEKRFVRPDGSVVWTIVSGGRPVSEDQENGFFYVQLLDITDRKQFEADLVEARDKAEQARKLLLKAHEELQRYADLQIRETQARERERMIRDMHDGFGSQLASLRLMAEQGNLDEQKLPEYLAELSADLSLIFDTLGQSSEPSLAEALADMRYRLQRRISSGNPKLHWHIDVPEKGPGDSYTNLHILRVVQEAVNNALRHASPGNIWITVTYQSQDKTLQLSVRDDGTGIREPVVRGRGLNNIENRVRELSAKLRWIEHAPGTELQVVAQI